MNCLLCGSVDIRPSKSSRWADLAQHVRGKCAYRCRGCGKRFYAEESEKTGLKDTLSLVLNQKSKSRMSVKARRRLMRKVVVLSVFAMAFALFWICLKFIIA